MRALWLTLMLAGCGRIGFGGLFGDSTDAPKPSDSRTVDAPPLDSFVFLDSPPSLDAFPGLTTSFAYADFLTCPAALVRIGDAHCADGTLQLTDDLSDQLGVVWTKDPYAITPTTRFALHLVMRISTLSPADGMAIVFQNSPAGNTARGMGGGYLAIEGVAPSFALELDTFGNTQFAEPGQDHVGFDRDGDVISIATALPPFTMHEGNAFHVWLDYDGPTSGFTAYVALDPNKPTAPVLTATDDLTRMGSTLYIGVTGTTGAAHQQNRVLAWRLDVL